MPKNRPTRLENPVANGMVDAERCKTISLTIYEAPMVPDAPPLARAIHKFEIK
jgi:hypothetical protein